MTERQRAAWPAAVDRARTAGADVNPDETGYGWRLHFHDESRPGRGHALDAWWTDGEHFVQITMDVYGYPSVSVASVDWIHADSNEECPCDSCVTERTDASS